MNPLDTLNRWKDAWNSGDTSAVAALYAEDAVFLHPIVPEALKGRDAIGEFLGAMGSAFSEIDVAVLNAVTGGDWVAGEVQHIARHTGDLPTPSGPLPATGKLADLPAAHFMRVGPDGLIVEEHMYANPLLLMTQLGAA